MGGTGLSSFYGACGGQSGDARGIDRSGMIRGTREVVVGLIGVPESHDAIGVLASFVEFAFEFIHQHRYPIP